MKTVRGKTDHVVVVGAGLAGIATAMRLAAAGRQVTVLERELGPGGRAGIWQSNGHLFDTGPTVLTMPNPIDDVFASLGERTSDWLEMQPVSPLYRTYYPDGLALTSIRTPQQMAAEIEAVIGPNEAAGYSRSSSTPASSYKLR
jgi:phytoene desaturase